MPTSTTATATWNAPVEITFRCPKCGKNVAITRYMRMTAQANVQHYAPERAEAKARNRLASDVDFYLRNYEKGLRTNRAILLGSKDQIWARTIPFKCPGCGIISIPDAGCKRKMLTPKWFAPFLIAVLYVWLVLIFIAASKGIPSMTGPVWFLVPTLIAAALITLATLFVSKRSKSAYGDPTLLEKRFKSVLNGAVYADMSPYGLGRIHMGSGE